MMLSALLLRLQDTGTPPSTDGATPGPAGDLGGAASAPSTPAWLQFLPMVAIFAIFYFVMIGPERKNRKKREAMLKAMKKGDEVMTSGGIYGTIAAIHENEITLQLSDSVRVRFARQAIQEVLSGNSSSEPAKS